MTTTSTVLPPNVERPERDRSASLVPPPEKKWHIPKLLFTVEDLDHPGALRVFQSLRDPKAFLQSCIIATYELLYTRESAPTNVHSVSIIFRSMDGVAHTMSSRLDNDHKEIHFSTEYIADIEPENLVEEIHGVLQHEMAHCFQNNGKGTCPGGLIEGMADYVRLQREFIPPHWTRAPGDKWDAGYESTAFFLEWIDQKFGEGHVRKLNEAMVERYEASVWSTLTGHAVESLWKNYVHECKYADS